MKKVHTGTHTRLIPKLALHYKHNHIRLLSCRLTSDGERLS
jgi:hypothetical protein